MQEPPAVYKPLFVLVCILIVVWNSQTLIAIAAISLIERNQTLQNNWIEEIYVAVQNKIDELEVRFDFFIHKAELGAFGVRTAREIRNLYSSYPTQVKTVLNEIGEELCNKLKTIYTSCMLLTKDVNVDEQSLIVASTTDYEPPVRVWGYANIKLLPDVFLMRAGDYELDDILYGLLSIDKDNRLTVPIELQCSAGHNLTIKIYAPVDFRVADDTKAVYSDNTSFEVENWLGASTVYEEHTLYYKAKGAPDCTYKMSAEVCVEAYDIKLALKNETLYLNLNVQFNLYRIHITPEAEKWFSRYLHMEYITSDAIRAAYKIHLIGEADVNTFLSAIKNMFSDMFEAAFGKKLDLKMKVAGLDGSVDLRNLHDGKPIILYIDTNFTYVIGEGGGFQTSISDKQIQIVTFTRTFSLLLGGIPYVYLNYTFKFPKFVEITEATCKYHNAVLQNNTVKINYGAGGGEDTLTITFAVDVELKLEPLMPYFFIIIALFIVWLVVVIYARKKRFEKEYEMD